MGVSQIGPLEDFDPSHLAAIKAIFEVHTLSRSRVYASFVSLYGPYIVSLVSKFNRVSKNTRDLIQDVYLHFTKSDIIRKFFLQVQDSIPETLTGMQSAKLLGMSWGLFELAQSRLRGTSFPKPLRGVGSDPNAVYVTLGVLEYSMDRKHFREDRLGLIDVSVLVVEPTRAHFLKYIAQSVHHHFANFCRSEFRHHRERVHDTFPEFRPTVDNPTPWEARLAAPTRCNQEDFAEMSNLFSKLEKSPASSHIQSLYNDLLDGYDIEQAIDHLSLSTDAKRLTKRMIREYIQGEQKKPVIRRVPEVEAH